jgi:hypothetical protein
VSAAGQLAFYQRLSRCPLLVEFALATLKIALNGVLPTVVCVKFCKSDQGVICRGAPSHFGSPTSRMKRTASAAMLIKCDSKRFTTSMVSISSGACVIGYRAKILYATFPFLFGSHATSENPGLNLHKKAIEEPPLFGKNSCIKRTCSNNLKSGGNICRVHYR